MHSRRYKRRLRREEKRKKKKQKFSKSFKSEDTITNLDVLYESAFLCKKGVMWKASTQKFIYDRLLNCYEIKSDVILQKKIHRGFVIFTLIERGKPREAYSIHIKERALQRTLSDKVLMPFILKYIVDRNCASIKGKGEIYAEKALKIDLLKHYKKYGNNGCIVFLDMSKYFYNINRQSIKEDFSCVGDDNIQNVIQQFSDSYSIFECFDNEIGYGLGTQFVQISGIFALNKLDHHIKECEIDGDKSTRYMDDTYILSIDDTILDKYVDKCEELGFKVNKDKCVALPINKPFIWLKKIYSLSDTGKVTVRIGYKAVTRERHAIMTRREWVEDNRITYYSYVNQVRSWLINIRKHYDSSAPCLVIEKTFQYCFYQMLQNNKAEYIRRLNKLLKGLEKENVLVLVNIATLYMAFRRDARVLSNVLKKPCKEIRYIEETKIHRTIRELDDKSISYVCVKANEKDMLDIKENLKVFNMYKNYG